uniref:Uncharacterized protein n=1 Tax=Anguilla anguilla TaxID=7936 RepID=A0A0E9TSM3_ANGAN
MVFTDSKWQQAKPVLRYNKFNHTIMLELKYMFNNLN